MADLKTRYMGLDIANPVVVGASKLTSSVEGIRQAEESGAGAVVCASLFEEQIQLEQWKMDNDIASLSDVDSEIGSFFPSLEHSGPREHLHWVKRAKESVKIPVIASLNAVEKATWVEYAKMLQDTGVDGLELNFYHIPGDANRSGADVEKAQLEVIAAVQKVVSIPVSVKLSYFYSNVLHLITEMEKIGVAGYVLFNRLFESDIDIDEEKHTIPLNLSSKGDNKLACRYMGLLFGKVKGQLCSNNGVFSGRDVVKAILSGASAVQVVSTLYKSRFDQISEILKDLDRWMEGKSYSNIDAFIGKLAECNVNDRFVYKRAQYVDLILRSNELLDAPGR
ncbi:MAG: dihydroorotate dehydrogenase-like protein [Puniceicoccaceae bacterium]